MKNLFTALALTLAFASFTQEAKAANLTLQGQINVQCDLTAIDTTPYANANTTLPIITGGLGVDVADALITCNAQTGYKLEAQSMNGRSRLENTFNPTVYYTDYQIQVQGAGTTGMQTLSSTPIMLQQTALSEPLINAPMKISLNVQPILTPPSSGVYEDTVVLTLTAL